MKHKASKTDLIFSLCLTVAFLYLSVFIFTYPYLYDEAFYATIPYRFAIGDGILEHEWHLSQFSSFFTYLPVKLWLLVKGSTEGIIVFSRCTFLCCHTALTVEIYRFFREQKAWAIVAALIFYTQTAYRMLALGYHSVFVIFLVLLTFCFVSILKKPSAKLYVASGLCYTCCCLCNPLFCAAFPMYLLLCVLWPKRETYLRAALKLKRYFIAPETGKKKKKQKNEIITFPETEIYACFFSKQAVIFSTTGILIMLIAFLIYFVSVGGTFTSITDNLINILHSTEYGISVISKLKDTFGYFSKISFGLPFLLPLLYIVMLLDGKRKNNTHRLVYIAVSVALAVTYIFGIYNNASSFVCLIYPLPFAVVSVTCYILTANKNKKLFLCMWLPALIGVFFQYTAANTHLSAIGVVLTVNNIAGVFFAKDLFIEMRSNEKENKLKNCGIAGRILLCCAICMQLIFHVYVYQYDQVPDKNATKASFGPYAETYMDALQYEHYCNAISDLDVIKQRSDANDPVLIVSYQNWMYLHSDRPMSVYTTWYDGYLQSDSLLSYYKSNPEKIPKYIYIDPSGFDFDNRQTESAENRAVLQELFDFTEETLSGGTLLTVTNIKF